MVREARKIAADYPGIELWETNVDAMVMWMVKNPQNYGVMVSSNMFGDIISDLAAQLVGGLGFAASGNIGDEFAVFEPTHGSAPKYAGQYMANPTAMLLATKLMLDWLGESGHGPGPGKGHRRRDRGGQGPHLRSGRRERYAGRGPRRGRKAVDRPKTKCSARATGVALRCTS